MPLDDLKKRGLLNRGYTKNPDKPPTYKERKFLDLIVYEYKPPREALCLAFPPKEGVIRDKNYALKKSSELLKKPNIAKLKKEMEKEMQEKLEQKGLWTREQAIEKLKERIEINEKEEKRIEETYNAQIDMLITKIKNETTPDKKEKLFNQMAELRKKSRVSQVYNSAILSSVSELNKMHGYNSQDIVIKHDETFEIDKRLAKMSDDELKAMLYKKDDEE